MEAKKVSFWPLLGWYMVVILVICEMEEHSRQWYTVKNYTTPYSFFFFFFYNGSLWMTYPSICLSSGTHWSLPSEYMSPSLHNVYVKWRLKTWSEKPLSEIIFWYNVIIRIAPFTSSIIFQAGYRWYINTVTASLQMLSEKYSGLYSVNGPQKKCTDVLGRELFDRKLFASWQKKQTKKGTTPHHNDNIDDYFYGTFLCVIGDWVAAKDISVQQA